MLKYGMLVVLMILSFRAECRVTKVVVDKVDKPIFGRSSFAPYGQYERVIGRYYGELDPGLSTNSVIVDLNKAEKNAKGKVEYSADFYILQPIEPNKKRNVMLYEFGNRGNKLLFLFNQLADTENDPVGKEHIGNGYLMRNGYTMVWSGFLGDVKSEKNVSITTNAIVPGSSLTIQLPIAHNADGSKIEETIWDECDNDLFANRATDKDSYETCPLNYPVPRMKKSEAKLLVRERRSDKATEIPADKWEFVDVHTVKLAGKEKFKPGFIYQFVHKAVDPKVMGIGYAAVRDWVTFLRTQDRDDFGNINPMRRKISHVLSYGVSQTARTQRDFVYLGFNQPESPGKLSKVIDGMYLEVGPNRPFVNYRFAQPRRGADLQHENLFYPDMTAPFSWDGLLSTCLKNKTCPRIFDEVHSSEYYQFRYSNITTDPDGKKDAKIPDNVRIFMFASFAHYADPEQGACRSKGNAISSYPISRGLLNRLDRWVVNNEAPPDSQYPRVANGTLVTPDKVKWPASLGLPFPKDQVNKREVYDTAKVPPEPTGRYLPVLVPQVDADGNEIAGIRVPEIEVPTGTFTGWNVRGSGNALGELCGLKGAKIPFSAETLKQRYGTEIEKSYLEKVKAAAEKLVSRGLMLKGDVSQVVADAKAGLPTNPPQSK